MPTSVAAEIDNRNGPDSAKTSAGSRQNSSSVTQDILSYPHEDSKSLSCPIQAPLAAPLSPPLEEQADDVVLVCTETKLDNSVSAIPLTEDKDALQVVEALLESSKREKALLEFTFSYQEKYYEQLKLVSKRLETVLALEAKEWIKANGPTEQVLARVVELRQQIFSEVEQIRRLIPNKYISQIPYARFAKAKALLDEAAWLTPKLAEPLRAEAKKLLHFMPTGFKFKDAIFTAEKWVPRIKVLERILIVVGFAPSIVDYLEAKSDEEKIAAFKKFGEEAGEALTGAAFALLIEIDLASGPVGWVVLGIFIASTQVVADRLGDKLGKAYFGPVVEEIARYFMRVPKPEVEINRRP